MYGARRRIASSKDLKGKLIGLRISDHAWSGCAASQHEYWGQPTDIHWRSGVHEEAGFRDRGAPAQAYPAAVDLKPIGKDQYAVVNASRRAIVYGAVQRAKEKGRNRSLRASRTSAAFPQTRDAERAYYERRAFPDHASRRIRKDRWKKYPLLPSSVYKGVLEANALAMIDLLDVNALMVTHPAHCRNRRDMATMGQGLLVLRSHRTCGEWGRSRQSRTSSS